MQVKIKKKQRLVKKELEPVITEDDMKNASHTDGVLHAKFLLDGLVLLFLSVFVVLGNELIVSKLRIREEHW